LTVCYEESEEAFLQGVRKVAEGHGGVAALVKAASLNCEDLYQVLSEICIGVNASASNRRKKVIWMTAAGTLLRIVSPCLI